jgi:uncharacterized protein
MRILAFSDLHQDLGQAEELVRMANQADVVVGAGDFASVHKGLEETIDALRGIEAPTILVPGNNETEDALREAAARWDAATVLHGESHDLDGVTFFGLGAGVPTTPWGWSFDLSEDEAERALAPAPEGCVLVLHSPPKGHVDDGLGSTAILAAVERVRPPLAVCGHIHQCWEQESRVGETLVRNLGPVGAYLEV